MKMLIKLGCSASGILLFGLLFKNLWLLFLGGVIGFCVGAFIVGMAFEE